MRMKKVLVPIGDTTFSLHVLPHVTELFDPAQCEITLLHVQTLPDAVTVGEQVVVFADQATASAQAEAITALQPYVRSLRSLGFAVKSMVRFGDPATQIEHVAEELNCDIIAMATHGRAGLDRVLRGSVAQEVVSHVDRPVMLYRANSDARAQYVFQ